MHVGNKIDGRNFMILREDHLEKMFPNQIGVVVDLLHLQTKVCHIT